MEEGNESILLGYPNIISYESTQKIIEQMEKNVCKIKIDDFQATGFFCKIPFPDKAHTLPTLITNNHVINNDLLNKKDSILSIKIKAEQDYKIINLDKRIKFTNKNYDTTIIEIKETDEIKNYLELDDKIIENILNDKNNNSEFIDETIYVLQYPKGKLGVSFGILDSIPSEKKYNFFHKCSTEGGSSGSPILNSNNKLIGIHKKGGINNKNNKGTFLNYPIKEFIKLNYKNDNKNEIIDINNMNNYINNNAKNNNTSQSTNLDKESDIFNYMVKIGDEYYFDENELLITEFRNKYNYDTLSNKSQNILLMSHDIRNEGFKDLCKIEFINLKELHLNENNISDIRPLAKAKFDNLKLLNLGNNIISDISILDKVNLKNLKELYLTSNYISDITVLERFNFGELEKLYLNFNKITDINVLEKVNFKKLKAFYLSDNKIDKNKYSAIISKMKSILTAFDV